MWCEIDQKDSKLANLDPIDISPEPKKDYEVRLIVWKTKDIEMMDFEGTSDVYVRSFLNPDKDKTTDTHYRNQDGNASFNWRNNFAVQSLEGDYVLTVQAWDWDLIGGDELIGECQFDITPLMDDAVITEKVRSMNYTYFSTYFKQALLKKQSSFSELANEIEFESDEKDEEKFWLPLRRYNQEADQKVEAGQV